jgi:L-serine/L-threonine ammonia-lyase
VRKPSVTGRWSGLGLLCQDLARNGVHEFVCSSGGNAGIACAYAGRLLSKKVTIVVPTTTSELTIAKLTREGANVVVHGAVWNEAHERTVEEAKRAHVGLVHPFDHPTIFRGHSTISHELRKQMPCVPDCIVLSVGGGGLLAGVVEGLRAIDDAWKDVPVVCCETEGTASFAAAMKAGTAVTIAEITGIALTLGSKRVCDRVVEQSKIHKLLSCVVTDREAVQGCADMLESHRVVVEPSCGAALAGVAYCEKLLRCAVKDVVVIACGGIGGRADLQYGV